MDHFVGESWQVQKTCPALDAIPIALVAKGLDGPISQSGQALICPGTQLQCGKAFRAGQCPSNDLPPSQTEVPHWLIVQSAM